MLSVNSDYKVYNVSVEHCERYTHKTAYFIPAHVSMKSADFQLANQLAGHHPPPLPLDKF